MDTKKPTILVLCTGNSCRSHLGEGLLRAAAGDLFNVVSAGSKPAGYVHPMAIAAMKEIGIDISTHTSKHMNEFLEGQVETVITVCGNADQACPIFPGQVNRHHWPFEDPAHATGTDEEKMEMFRRVRNEIRRVFTAYADGRRDQIKSAAKKAVAV
ncbi:MAG: arsenate reductase ArsC [Opitutaceae bacterium]|jgi:arsenate reductase